MVVPSPIQKEVLLSRRPVTIILVDRRRVRKSVIAVKESVLAVKRPSTAGVELRDSEGLRVVEREKRISENRRAWLKSKGKW